MPTSAPLEPNLRQPAPDLGPRAQRTIEAILDATREIFLTQGYGGTAIDDITTRAGVSRASFYTYFPTKRDALLALGSGATVGSRALVAALDELPSPWTIEHLASWLGEVYEFFDKHGSFGLAWGQAAHQDAELRSAGMKAHLHTCALLGQKLNGLRRSALMDDTQFGLYLFSMFERTWAQQKLYEPDTSRDDIVASGADLLAQLLRD